MISKHCRSFLSSMMGKVVKMEMTVAAGSAAASELTEQTLRWEGQIS